MLLHPTHVQAKGISEQTLKDISLTYITPEKLFGHYEGIEQIVPLARRTGFVARCGDGFVRRYDQTVESLSAAAQPKAKAKFHLYKMVPTVRDTFVTNVSIKADGKWMLVTTSAAIYLTNWVDDAAKSEDYVIAELGLDPKATVPDLGDYEFHAAKFDSSIEDDVTNPAMCEKHIGAFIKPGDNATYKDTVMVQWSLRNVFSDDNLKITTDDDEMPVFRVGICKLYEDHRSSPATAASTPTVVVDEWTWHKGSHAIAALGDAMKTMKMYL